MKLADWFWSWIKGGGESALYASLWLFGAPALLAVILLSLRPLGEASPTPYMKVDRWIEPVVGYTFDQNGFVALMQKPADFTHAQWSQVDLPNVIPLPAISDNPEHPKMARAWFRIRYIPPSTPLLNEQIALYGTRIMGGAYSVWVNGELIDTSLSDWRMQWNNPLFAKIPDRHVVPGQTMDILLAVPYRLTQGYSVGTLYMGSISEIRPFYDVRVFVQTTLPQAALLVALLLGVITFQYWLNRRQETLHLLLTLTALAWFICNLQYFIDISDDEKGAAWFGYIVDVSISWLLPLLYLFALRFAKRRYPWLERSLIAYAVAMTLITMPIWGTQVTALLLHHYFDLVLGIGMTSLITWLAFRGGSLEIKVIAIALWSLVFFGAYDLMYMASQRYPDGIHLFPYSTFMLFGAFLFSLQRRYIQAQSDIEALNLDLDRRLKAREAELEAKHRQLREIEQHQTLLQERQRLMQDMHDGIGSTLMTSLVMAEQGRLPPERMAAILRESVDELKMVIDSLEPIGRDLVTLLGNLRYRLASRLESAGIRIIWNMGDLPPLDWLEPPQALQVLRILQEALTNILKHAQATEVRVAASQTTDESGQAVVIVEIADNGAGFDPHTKTYGRGLNNMQERAKHLGATVAIRSEQGQGTRAMITLPLAIPDNA